MKESGFERKKVRSLTLGEKLRGLREDENIQVQDLSRKINVKVSYIELLEAGDYKKLPTKVYVKGFVLSYARFFDVREDILLDLFEREYSVYSNINQIETEDSVNRLAKLPKFVFTPRILMIVVVFVLLSGIGLYLYFSVDNFVSSPWLIVEEPLNNSIIKANNVVVSGKTRSNSKVLINGQQVFVDADGMFSDKINLSQGVNEIVVNSVNKFEKESIEKLNINAEFDVQEKKQEDIVKSINITIKAKEKPILINIVSDDVEIYDDVIEIDDEKVFDANEKIIITSSSGSNTLISEDGEEFNAIGEKDEIIRDWVFEGSEEVDDDEKSDN